MEAGDDVSREPSSANVTLGPRWVHVLIFGLATFFAFPQVIAGHVLDLGLLVSPLAPMGLLLAIDGLAPRRAMRFSFLLSLAAHFLLFHWFFVVTYYYGHAPLVVGMMAPLAPALYLAIGTAIFGGVWARLCQRGLGSPLVAATLWTAIDHLGGFALGGFPWATIGYAQHLNPMLMGLAPWTGVYGLSFAVALLGAALARAWRDSRRNGAGRPSAHVLTALLLVALLHLPGLLPSRESDAGQTLRVAGLQGNIDQGEKWSREREAAILENYLALSREVIAEGAEVVVWPETAVPGFIEYQAAIREPIAALAREHDVAFVLGATGITLSPDGREIREFFDSAFLMQPDGEIMGRYDKTHLVPFGEYVPLRGLLGHFFEAVATGLANNDVTAGERPRAYALPIGTDSQSDPRSVIAGVPICYELLFPDLVRRFSGDRAQVLFAITNDAWYGRTGAPYQFLAMTAMRSAENRLWTVRAANSGVSAVIDGRGRVVRQTEIFERSFVIEDIPLVSADSVRTFYARRGDLFAGLCWLGVLAIHMAAFRAGRRDRVKSNGLPRAGSEGTEATKTDE